MIRLRRAATARASSLLARAAARYDESIETGGSLAPRLHERSGFEGGTRWMARALRVGIDDETARRGGSLARTKYAAALLGGLLGGAACAWGHPLLSVFAFVLGFYAVEVQGVFLLPCLVTGDPSPLAGSRALVRRSGGTLFAIFRILPIAAWMLVGAFVRPAPNRFAFVRTWCEGCLAVVLWFEDLRRP